MSNFVQTIPWWVWGLGALVVAAVFAFVWPHSPATAELPAIQQVVLRWGHSVVWVLLALFCFLRGWGVGWANIPAVLAGLIYAVFVFTTIQAG